MKKSVVLFSLLAACGGFITIRGQETAKPGAAPVASTQADRDWQAYQDVQKRVPANAAQMSRREQMEFLETRALEQRTLALAFIEKYPADPRRWSIVMGLSPLSPRFIKEFGPHDAQGVPATVIDEVAAAAWKAKVAELKGAMAKATDVPADVLEQQAWADFAKDFRATTMAKQKGEPFDYAPFHARFDAHVAKFGQLPNMPARARDYLGALESMMPGAGAKEWTYLLGSSHEGLRTTATEQLATLERKANLAKKPLELAFTAVDGRAVDVAKLRGKVVLVDFWATWCGPCIGELPNVKKVYAAYHDKGFEIIGISLDRDTDRQKLIDFTAKEEMPWPQHYDGKYWQNEVAVKYDIRAIPAMFLLDQEGKVVSTNARGPKLEAEVKRLLGL